MTIKKHTPGPWLNDPADGALILAKRKGALVSVAEAFHVDNEQPANASLIAAAPEMLEVLKDMVCKPCDTKDGTPHPWCDRARALLAKIGGR